MQINIKIGGLFTKKELSTIFNDNNISIIREGIYYNKYFNSTLLFVDLNKEGKEERFHFRDYFENDIFQWDSQTTQSINSPRIQSFVKKEVFVLLFCRVNKKINNKTMPFVYCGRLEYLMHDIYTSNPVHIYFKSLDYEKDTENINLKNIYEWNLNYNLIQKKEIDKVAKIFKTEIKNDEINNLKIEISKHKDDVIIKEYGSIESYQSRNDFKIELRNIFINIPGKNINVLKEYRYLYEKYFINIDNFNELDIFLRNNKSIINKNLYIKLQTFSNYTANKLSSNKIPKTVKEILLNEEKFIDEKEKLLFNKNVNLFYIKSKISNRSKNLISKLEIDSLEKLSNLINNYEEIKHVGSFGIKTIDDLEKLQRFLIQSNIALSEAESVKDVNTKNNIIEEWNTIYNDLSIILKEKVLSVILDKYKIENGLNFDELYKDLNEDLINIKINDDHDDDVVHFFLKVLYSFYKKVNKPNTIYRYNILLNNKVFKLLCKAEFEKLLIRTKNFLKQKYGDDKLEINYNNFLYDYLNDDPLFIPPVVFGKTGNEIEVFIVSIKNIFKEIINNDLNTSLIKSKYLLIKILGDFEIDKETLNSTIDNKLDLENFFVKYFDVIFSDIYSTSKIVIKFYFNLDLSKGEKEIISKLSKERIRQINKRTFIDKKFEIYRNRIKALANLTLINFKLKDNYYKIYTLKNYLGIDDKMNYKFYRKICLLFNPSYYLINVDLNNSKIDNIETNLLINSNFINEVKVLEIKEILYALINNKHYKEYDCSNFLSNEDGDISELEKLIGIILQINNLSEQIEFKDNKIYNTKNPKFIDIVEAGMIFYKSTVTIKMLKSYINEVYPNLKFVDTKIISTILNNKNLFFHLGKTGRYGLLKNQQNENLEKGFKSIRNLIDEYLKLNKRPVHINEIVKDIVKENKSLRPYSVERIIAGTKDFESIGQSFYLQTNSKLKYEPPVNHKKVESINLKFIKQYDLESKWVKKDLFIENLKNKKVPYFQINYIVNYLFYVYKNKITTNFDIYIYNEIEHILDDNAIEKAIKKRYENSSLSIKIQIRKNLKKYIQSVYYVSIIEEDIQKIINYHIQ